MITDVRVPPVSENVKQGKVVSVLVAPGEDVAAEQALIELETDKAVVEIPSPAAGRVAEVVVAPGETLAIGALIARLELAEGSAAPASPVAPPPAAPAAAAPPAPAPAAPPVPASPSPPPPAPTRAAREDEPLDDTPAPASPSVRRLARELGVTIDDVVGSGEGGRIGEEDVKTHARQLIEGAVALRFHEGCPAPGRILADAPPSPDFARWGPIRREPLTRVREVTAETLSYAWATVPQVTQFDQADVTELEEFRKAYAQQHPDAHLTMTAILVKVAAAALRAFPRFNASLDAARREIVTKDYVHVAVAVDTEHGLLVPVVRDADRKGIARVAAELATLSAKARTRRISPADLEGGCFTISNLGGIGGTAFSPIVYPPQVAILGVSRATISPVWRDGAFAPRLLLPLALTYDHRVIDGADGARFLHWFCDALRQPLVMMMDG